MYAFFQGKIVPLADAKISIMTHGFLYGYGAFEGVRGNWNEAERQVYIFRAKEHFERLHYSAKAMHIKLKYSVAELTDIATKLVEKCDFHEDLYLRPTIYKSDEAVANLNARSIGDDFLMLAVKLANYMDPNRPIHCQISNWRRTADSSISPRVKSTGVYINSILARTEAVQSGFDEAIMLNQAGHVSEGSGENLFIISKGKLVTPSEGDDILSGITRASIMELARNELHMETVERSIPRGELYSAEEVFLTGTAAHLTPVGMIDHRPVGDGKIGPITNKLQQAYFDAIRGRNKKYSAWTTPVYATAAAR